MSSVIKIQTGILIVNLENFDNSLTKIKHRHEKSLIKDFGRKTINQLSQTTWKAILNHLEITTPRDTNVLIGGRDTDIGTIMFLNVDLAEKFANEIIKAFEKDLA